MSGRGSTDIGSLRHRFIHETPIEVPDGMGGVRRTFIRVDELWGAIATRAVVEEIADRPGAVLAHSVTLRAPATIKPGDRLKLGARCLLVEAVRDREGRGRYLECSCREETP